MSPWAVIAALCVGVTAARAEPAQAPNAGPTPPSASAILTVAVPSTDLARSFAFYSNGLGLTAAGRLESSSTIEAPLIFPGGGPTLLLVKAKVDGAAPPVRGPLSRVVLTVSDVKGLETRLAAAGYHLKAPPSENPRRHVVVGLVEDPDGNLLELVQRTP